MFARFLAALASLLLLPTLFAMVPAEAARRAAPIKASLTDIPQGSSTVFSGRVPRGPRPVRIQQRIPTQRMGRAVVSWIPVSGEFFGRPGKFSIRVFPPGATGKYTYRAVAPRWQGRKRWISATKTVRVVRVGNNPDVIPHTIATSARATPASTSRPLSWGRTDTVYPMAGATAVSCTSADFCAIGTSSGQVVIDTKSATQAAAQLGTSPIVGVSCTSSNFCMALDKTGKAYKYNGTNWWGPTSINDGHTSTGIGCMSENACVAVDQEGYGVPYVDGAWWARQAGSVDSTPAAGGFTGVSCAVGAVACAITSPGGITLYVFIHNPSGPSPSFTRQFRPWAPEADRPAFRGTVTDAACPASAACLVTNTQGQATSIDNRNNFFGIPIPNFNPFDYRAASAPEPNAKAVVGCRSEDSCLIVDNKGELLAGNFVFGAWNFGSLGALLPNPSTATDMSCPLGATESCLVIATDGLHRITN